MSTHKPTLWSPGDWNAFFGFGTNILVNMLTLTALLRFVLKMPDAIVFGRILPATGLMLCLSTLYYAWLAHRLARQTGRNDVCAGLAPARELRCGGGQGLLQVGRRVRCRASLPGTRRPPRDTRWWRDCRAGPASCPAGWG